MLQNAHAAATDFLSTFQKSREGKGRGRSTDADQDLLRAMLVFATAGLDAMFKELVRRALPVLIDGGIGGKAFESFITRRAEGAGPVDHKFLAEVLASLSPRGYLIRAWVTELTGGSLQSVDAVLKTASAFDIQFPEIFKDTSERNALKEVFEARNQIIHEMDLEFTERSARRLRKIEDMRRFTEQVFQTGARILAAVETRLDSSARSAA